MATKVIKLQNSSYTLLPVTDANLVQMTVDNETKSVYDVILEDEEVTAAAFNDLDSRLETVEEDYVINSTLDNYVTKAYAQTTYATITHSHDFSNSYAPKTHSHDFSNSYAPKDHVNAKATTSVYGHVIVDDTLNKVNSINPVQSKAILAYLNTTYALKKHDHDFSNSYAPKSHVDDKASTTAYGHVIVDNSIKNGSINPVQNTKVYEHTITKASTTAYGHVIVDDTLNKVNSVNPVQSKAILAYLNTTYALKTHSHDFSNSYAPKSHVDAKATTSAYGHVIVDNTLNKVNSVNPVQSKAILAYLNTTYALKTHSHDFSNSYAPKSHVDAKATTSAYGHVIVDNTLNKVNSINPVQSNAILAYLNTTYALKTHSHDFSNSYAPKSHVDAKATTSAYGHVIVDNSIKNGSINPVQNTKVYEHTITKASTTAYGHVIVDDTLNKVNSVNPVQSKAILAYLNTTYATLTQINNINNTLASGLSFKGIFTNEQTSKLPTSITASGWTYAYAGNTSYTLLAAQSLSGTDEILRKGDVVISAYNPKTSTYMWAAIDNNTDIATASIPGLVKEGVSSNTTMGVDVGVDGAMTVDHYNPENGSIQIQLNNASYYNGTYTASGLAGAPLSAGSGIVITGLKWHSDKNGHVTKISYTLGKLPAETQLSKGTTSGSGNAVSDVSVSNHTITLTKTSVLTSYLAWGKLVAGADSTSTGAGTANTNNALVNGNHDTLTVSPGNKWITTGVTDGTNSDTLYINHAAIGAVTPITSANTATASASGATAAWSIDVVKGVTISYDNAGHVTGVSVTSGKLPGNPNVTSSIFVGKSDSTSSAVTTNTTTYILHKEGSSVNSKIGVQGDNKWIEISYNPVNSYIYAYHIGPQTGTVTNATYSNSASFTASNLSGAALAHGTGIVITGIKYSKDARGHITDVSYTLGKLPAAPTDNNDKVKVYGLSDNKAHSLLFKYEGGANASTSGDAANYVGSDSDGITNAYYNPSTNTLYGTNIIGSAVTGVSTLKRGAEHAVTTSDSWTASDNIVTTSGTYKAKSSGKTIAYMLDASHMIITYGGVTANLADTIIENEEVTAAALNDLNTRLSGMEGGTFGATIIGNTASSGFQVFSYTMDDTTKNVYVPAATSTTLGVIKGSYTAANGGYPVKFDSNGNAYANLNLVSIDGVNVGSVQNIIHHGTCSTGGGTAAKTAAISGFKLITGSECVIYFSNTNTAASPTLSVNSTTAKAIYWHGVQVQYNTLVGGHYYHFVYDGTYYRIVGSSFHNIPYGSCSIAAATAAKTVVAPGFHLCEGATINVRFVYRNTADSPTLNVNSLGAKNIFYNGSAIGSTNTKYLLHEQVTLVYDGVQFNICSANAKKSIELEVYDDRTVSDAPYAFPKSITAHFKQSGTNGLSRGFSTVMQIVGWGSTGTDTSGGPAHELAFAQTNGEIWHRYSLNATTWNNWEQIQESHDMNLTSSLNASTNVQTLTFSYSGGTRTVDMNIRYDIINSTMTDLSLF